MNLTSSRFKFCQFAVRRVGERLQKCRALGQIRTLFTKVARNFLEARVGGIGLDDRYFHGNRFERGTACAFVGLEQLDTIRRLDKSREGLFGALTALAILLGQSLHYLIP